MKNKAFVTMAFVYFLAFGIGAQVNPYCVSGASWAPNGVMIKLGMPASALGYNWGGLVVNNTVEMLGPCKPGGYCAFQRYDVTENRIVNATQFQQWIVANPGKIYLMSNEPNLQEQDGITPQQYARMHHDYVEFISAIDPTARFATGGLYLETTEYWFNANINWWTQVFDYYRTNYPGETMRVDIFNFHIYVPPYERDPMTTVEGYIEPMIDYWKSVEEGIYSDVEVWITEFGVGFWKGALNMEYLTPFMHRFCLALENSRVDRWFWFVGAYSPGSWENTSLLGPDGTPTQLGAAYVELANNWPNTEVTPMPDPQPKPVPDIFVDNFDSGIRHEDWIEKAGKWSVVDGAYRVTVPYEFYNFWSVLPYNYTDQTIEFDVRIDSAQTPTNWAGVSFRRYSFWDDLSKGGYLVFLRQNGYLGLHSAFDGTLHDEVLAVEDTSVFNNIKIVVSNWKAHIQVFVNGEKLIEFHEPNDWRRWEGFTALQINRANATFDNVSIRTHSPMQIQVH